MKANPDALQSETERKQLLGKAIKKMFGKESTLSSHYNDSTKKLQTVAQKHAKAAQTRLEKFSEGFTPVAAAATKVANGRAVTRGDYSPNLDRNSERGSSVLQLESKHDSI